MSAFDESDLDPNLFLDPPIASGSQAVVPPPEKNSVDAPDPQATITAATSAAPVEERTHSKGKHKEISA